MLITLFSFISALILSFPSSTFFIYLCSCCFTLHHPLNTWIYLGYIRSASFFFSQLNYPPISLPMIVSFFIFNILLYNSALIVSLCTIVLMPWYICICDYNCPFFLSILFLNSHISPSALNPIVLFWWMIYIYRF